jgi:hypothetical protein
MTKKRVIVKNDALIGYGGILSEVIGLLEAARHASVRSINSVMTTTYWEIGRCIVEHEQKSRNKADYYGEQIVEQLSKDLTVRFGRGFKRSNLFQMRAFYLAFPEIVQTMSGQSPKTFLIDSAT